MNFERTVLTGVLRKVQEVYGFTPTFISHGNRLRLRSFLNKTSGGANSAGNTADELTYPMLFLFPRNLARDPGSYNAHALQHRPLMSSTGGNNQNQLVREHRLVPVLFEFEFIHITPDFWQMIEFSSLSIRNNVNQNCLSFQSVYDGIAVDVRVEIADSIAIPEKDSSIEQSDWYESTTQLIVHAYVSEDLAKVLNESISQITAINVNVH